MRRLVQAWEDVRLSLSQIGDIGEFDPEEIEITEYAPGSWIEGRHPIGLDELQELELGGLHTPGSQAVYAKLAEVAARRLGIRDPLAALAFGEFYGEVVSGWSGRFGSLDPFTGQLLNVFCGDGYYRAAYIYEEDGKDWFSDPEVQALLASAFWAASRLHVDQS